MKREPSIDISDIFEEPGVLNENSTAAAKAPPSAANAPVATNKTTATAKGDDTMDKNHTTSSTPQAILGATLESNVAMAASTPQTLHSKASVTFGGQETLPPLPIPSLDETLSKFLSCLEALQEEESQRQLAEQVVLDFLKGDGPKLQSLLLEYDRQGRELGSIGSYVEEFWNDSYLAPDSSVVLNLNPFFVLEDSPDPKISNDPIRRAASLCFASVKMATMLRTEKLKPDSHRGKPLCMDQFKALFGASRVPMRNSKDTINVYDKSNHVAVMCCSRMYYFQALWPDGDCAVDEGDLVDILSAIWSHAHDTLDPVTQAQNAIGILTSLPRREWAVARDEMVKCSPKNEESLQIVDSALFVLVLDDYIPKNKHEAASNMLHGSYELKHSSDMRTDYQVGSCCNRWYDKLQIIVCGDATAGINFEHSAIDGHTALRFVSDVYAETVLSFAHSITKLVKAHDLIPSVIHATVRRAATVLDTAGRTTLDVFPKRLSFELPDSVHRKIYFAETALGDEIVATETFVLEFKDYGKLFIVGNSISPDSYVQMSMMLAYYKLYGKMVCAYEPVLTKAFYHGRTEAMRPATMEAKHLCETFCNPRSSNESKLVALRNATRVHSQLVKECAKGKGVDRHLFALKCIAEKCVLPIPSFFQAEPWKMLNHTVLSTSNCGNPALAGFGFGPVVPDGLGIGYIIKDTCVHYSISSKHRQTTRYAFTLENVLRDMAALLEPLSDAHVETDRTSLTSIPRENISYDSYGDIWGESETKVPIKLPPNPTVAVVPLNDTKSVLANGANGGGISGKTGPQQSAALSTTSTTADETPLQRRWEAEPQEGDVAQDDESDDVEVVVPLVDTEPDIVSPETSTKGEGDGTNGGGKLKMKRRGSNDLMPVVPCRRSSMVGGAVRQSSFEYRQLSHKGLSIDMGGSQHGGSQPSNSNLPEIVDENEE